MSHVIEIPETLYRRLQALAEPFVDRPIDVIEKAVSLLELQAEGSSPIHKPKKSKAADERIVYRAAAPPNLTHTKLICAVASGEEVDRPNWNELNRVMHKIAFEKLGSAEKVRLISSANIVAGAKDDEGYKPLNGTGLSVQGVDANDAWRISYELAKRLEVPLSAEFRWREKDDAEHPGEFGVLQWDPS